MCDVWKWLDDLTVEDVRYNPLPIRNLLNQSVYYPASGTDGDPVPCLNRLSRSFIYVDYHLSSEHVIEEMLHPGFRGYRIFAQRMVRQDEIINERYTPHDHPTQADGDPRRPYNEGWIYTPPYAIWTIWDRREGYYDEHGPNRFSLFYLCADGVASFDALYYTWELRPLVFCIIRPGTGFGFNWTDFREPGLIMHRLVMNNPAGIPEYMLVEEGLDESETCKPSCYWPEYQNFIMECRGNNLFSR